MEDLHSDLFVPIELVALDTVQNVRHRYAVRVTADLFGAYIVETEWGKIGTKGQSNRRAFSDQCDAARYVFSLLRRRDNAEKRNGRAYIPVRSVFF